MIGENMETVNYLDIDRFMGDWYVIAIIPNFIEKYARNGIESYKRGKGNKIEITYTFFNKKQGRKRVMHPKGEIYNRTSNAEWRVQFIWPLKFPYLVLDLADDYRYTSIGVPNKKFVWIMSRTAQMSENDYANALKKLANLTYDVGKIQKMEQIWD
jgi:apolipoprotein D and lipocalin family protein